MIDPEMRLLRYFVVLAEERHFGRAGGRLHMAQPPLSQQIRKLERQLGVELIDRTRRPIELTGAGEAVFKEAELSVVHGRRAFAAARRAAPRQASSVTCGSAPWKVPSTGCCRMSCACTETKTPTSSSNSMN
jgi:DNA-binding transcriptional LysR family regulator